MLGVAVIGLMLGACNDSRPEHARPIILGDSSLIVTEEDEKQLKDLVVDLQPVIPPAEDKHEDPQPAAENKDTATAQVAKPVEQPAPIPKGPGLKAEFSEVTVFIPGLDVSLGGNKNLKRAHGASYALVSGEILGSVLRVTGTVTKVSQRYQSIVVLNSSMLELPLDRLIKTTGWEEIQGGVNGYPIKGLEAKSLEFTDANSREIKKAIQHAAQRKRISRSTTQDLMNEVRHVKSADQKPLAIKLKTVMWKIDGKDEDGKFYSKQIRIDIPM
jgi:hypothetical protein